MKQQTYIQRGAQPVRKLAYGGGAAGVSLTFVQPLVSVMLAVLEQFAPDVFTFLTTIENFDLEKTLLSLIPVIFFAVTGYITKERV